MSKKIDRKEISRSLKYAFTSVIHCYNMHNVTAKYLFVNYLSTTFKSN